MSPGQRFRSGAEERTTGPRMELAAALDAIQKLEGPLEIVSDSTYLVNCFRNSWWKKWLDNNWLNSKHKPVANRDLWEPIIEEYQTRPIVFRLTEPRDEEWTTKTGWLAGEAARIQQSTEGEADHE